MRESHTAGSSPAQIDWPRFLQLIGSKQRILLTTHHRPDGDAVGSELGMYHVLRRLGKEVATANPFELPPNLHFIDPDGVLVHFGKVSAEMLQSIDLVLILDTSSWAQLGGMGDVIRATSADVAVVDHHLSGDDLGAIVFKDTAAEATGRLVYEAAVRLGVDIAPEIAKPLFVALATDTGWFRFSSTGERTYELAARLAAAGAAPDQIYKELYECETLARLNLTGRVLARAKVELGGRLIYTWITLEDFDASGALPGDSEDLINMTLAVKGTEFAVIFVEQRTGGFKLSFRSRCHLDCSQIAGQFGGGGHKNAAGALIQAPLEEARTMALDVVRKAMQ